MFISNCFFYRGCEKPEPCQLLSERRQSGAENKSKRSRPAEHGDAAGVDVTSGFPVWACASVEPRLNMKSSQQKNNQIKPSKKTPTGCCFHFPGESPEILRTFWAQQHQRDRRQDKKPEQKLVWKQHQKKWLISKRNLSWWSVTELLTHLIHVIYFCSRDVKLF